MSIGRLLVELELRDGQFHGRMLRAQQSVNNLSGSFNGLDNRLRGIERGLSGTLPHLRDIAIVTSSLHSVLSTVNDTFGEFTRSLLTANAEIERSKTLLQGLSKSVDTEGKLAEATRDMKFLFDTAKSAPFALKELSNSFVKMRTVGLGDVETKVKSLTNAIANFGGDDQALHRATVAIQQMASKGVISMEELRQQLGESVPNAMNEMADGMGMTMGSLIQKISEGKVRAVPAIEGMMQEMEYSMAGSSERMMETWNGMMSQFSTNWMLLQKQVGDAGFFDAAKDELKKLNEFLQSEDALKYAQMLGDGMKSAIDAVHAMTVMFEENKDVIGETVKVLLEFWAVTKAIAGVGAIFGGFGRGLSATRNAARDFGGLRPTTRTTTTTSETADFANGRIGGGLTEVVTETTAWLGPIALVTAALKLIPGPLGIIASAVGIAALQFIDFGSEAEKALDGIINKQEELNSKGVRVNGDAALKTLTDIKEARASLKALEEEQAQRLIKLEKERTTGFSGQPVAAHDTARSKKIEAEYAETEKKAKLSAQAIAESQIEFIDRALNAQKEATKKAVELSLAATTTEYRTKTELIHKGAEELSKTTKKTQDELDDYTRTAVIGLHKETLDSQLAILDKQKSETLKTMAELQASKEGSNISAFIDNEKLKVNLTNSEAMIRLELAKIDKEFKAATDAAKKAELGKQLQLKKGELDQTVTELKSVNNQLDELKTSDGLDWETILKYTDAENKLSAISALMDKLFGRKKLADQGKLPSDGAFNDFDSEKTIAIEKEKAEQILTQQLQGLASLSSNLLETHTKNFDKLAIKNGVGMSEGLAKGFSQAQGSSKFSNDLKSYLAIANDMLNEGDKLKAPDAKDTLENARMIAQIRDNIDAEAKALDGYTKAQVVATKAQENYNRAKTALTTGVDTGKTKSSAVIDLEREIKDATELGRPIETLQKQLSSLSFADSLDSQTEGLKKTYAEYKRITEQQEREAIAKEGFLSDLKIKGDKDRLQSELELNRDSVGLYQADVDNYVAAQMEKARQYGVVLDKERADHKAKLEAEYKAIKDNNVRIAIENNRRKLDGELRINAISRRPGTSYDRDMGIANEKHRQDLEDAKHTPGGQLAIDAAVFSANQRYIDDLSKVEHAHRTTFEKMIQEQVRFKDIAGDAATTFTNGLMDGMVLLATEGSDNFRQFATSVLKDISAMLIKMALLKALQEGFKYFGFADGGTTNSAGFSSSLGSFNADAAQGLATGGMVRIAGFANGGAMTAQRASKSEMQRGGVKNKPHLALFAEAGVPEAFIPMRDGKSIPLSVMRDENGQLSAKALLPGGRFINASVQETNIAKFAMGGVMGSVSGRPDSVPTSIMDFTESLRLATVRINGLFSAGDQAGRDMSPGTGVSITINVDDKGGSSRAQGGSGPNSEVWSKMADNIKGVVMKTLVEQKRPGGLIWTGNS
ncbi:tape measure protein [Methylobacter sp.]